MLQKRGKIYYCRLWVPEDLRDRLGRRELKKSLQTSKRSEAKVAAAEIESHASTTFYRLRMNILTDRELEILAAELIASFTGRIDAHRLNFGKAEDFLVEGVPVGWEPTQDVHLLDSTFKTPKLLQEVHNLVDTYSKRIVWLQEQAVTGLYDDYIRRIVAQKIEADKLSIPLPPPAWYDVNDPTWYDAPPPAFGKVCLAVINALSESYKVEQERLLHQRNTPLQQQIAARIEAAKPKPTLSNLYAEYKAGKLTKHKWNDESLAKYEAYYRDFLKYLGDKELADYQAADAYSFIEQLRKAGNTSSTISGKLEFLSSMFKHAIKTHEASDYWKVRGNPFAEQQPEPENDEQQPRIPYSQDDLLKLVTGLLKVRKQVEPHRFWVPLVALFSGARQGEVCQLRTVDVELEGKIPVFKFWHRPAHRQKMKWRKERTCPVHPTLVRLGFMDFVEQQRKHKHDRLFHTLSYSPSKKWSGKIRSWWNKSFTPAILGETGITGKTFHSLRKSFTDWFKQNGAYDAPNSRMILQSMIGHDFESDVTGKHYESAYPANTQYKLLRKLDYGFDAELISKLRDK